MDSVLIHPPWVVEEMLRNAKTEAERIEILFDVQKGDEFRLSRQPLDSLAVGEWVRIARVGIPYAIFDDDYARIPLYVDRAINWKTASTTGAAPIYCPHRCSQRLLTISLKKWRSALAASGATTDDQLWLRYCGAVPTRAGHMFKKIEVSVNRDLEQWVDYDDVNEDAPEPVDFDSTREADDSDTEDEITETMSQCNLSSGCRKRRAPEQTRLTRAEQLKRVESNWD